MSSYRRPIVDNWGHAGRPDHGHPVVYESRAGAGLAGRQADRYLGVRLRALRNAGRPASVCCRDGIRSHRGDSRTRPGLDHVARGDVAGSSTGPPPMPGRRIPRVGCRISATRVSRSKTCSRRAPEGSADAVPSHARPPGRRAVPWAVAGALAALALTAFGAWRWSARPGVIRTLGPLVRSAVVLPDGMERTRLGSRPALSPDGTMVVFSAVRDGRAQLFSAPAGRRAGHTNRRAPSAAARRSSRPMATGSASRSADEIKKVRVEGGPAAARGHAAGDGRRELGRRRRHRCGPARRAPACGGCRRAAARPKRLTTRDP